MTFTQSILSGFNNYSNFKDSSTRSEHWNWVLFTVVSAIIISFVEKVINRTNIDKVLYNLKENKL